ncbi:MAG: hypothetical protein PHR83_18120 [Paludibacter sp.]|nr:hypothetical protein [Paludibacter sp.]
MEIKKCLFCGENVLAEAIKCKHCGERFDTVEFEGVTFIQKNKNKELIYQDFDKIKLYFGLFVASSFIAMIFSIFLKTYFLAEIVSTSLWVWLMLFLKNYLQNFQRYKFNLLLSTLIIIYVISQIILTLSEKFGEEDSVMAIALLLLISWLVIFIIIGIRLKKLARFDFIGKMKQFGNSIIIFIPISLILTLIGAALKENGELLILSYFFLLIGYIATIYPFVIMVQMFMLAKDHQDRFYSVDNTESTQAFYDERVNNSEGINNEEKIQEISKINKPKILITIGSFIVFVGIICGLIWYFNIKETNSESSNLTSNISLKHETEVSQEQKTDIQNIDSIKQKLPRDFLRFIEIFTTNKATQILSIKFPLKDSNSNKILNQYNAQNWGFVERKWYFEGKKIYDGTNWIGSFYVENSNKISYSLGIVDSDLINSYGFERINGKWLLVDFWEFSDEDM